MLKNKDIISQLTDSQKVRILTGVGNLTGKDFKILGLRGVSIKNIKNYGSELFPRSSILSCSWNEQLWQEVATSRINMAKNDGADVAIVPGAKIKFSPYRRETTEDPFLAVRFSEAHTTAANRLGVRSAVSGYYLTEADVKWMDKKPSERIIGEYITSPYLHTLKEGMADAVMTDLRPMSDAYRTVCRDMQSSVPKDKYLICEMASEEDTVDFISRGIICLSASQNALEVAMNRYKKLKSSIDKGEGITPEQMLAEEQSLRAISPEAVDKALDHVIDFIQEERRIAEASYDIDNDELSFRSATESTVLLKNEDDILPLDKKNRIALVGDILPNGKSGKNMLFEIQDELQLRGYQCVGAEPGYSLANIHDSDPIERAMTLANSADTVVLFLGFGNAMEKRIHRTCSLDLPPNQLKLAHMLIKRKKEVIGIIAAGHAPDIAFTHKFKAVMLAPLELHSTGAAIVSILNGDVSPTGKLPYTLYAESETAFAKRELYKVNYGLKSGPFIGYRYYDTASVNVGYPFGHGLTYAKFKYSALSYSSGSVRFVVENTTDVAASEVAQVYVGHTSSNVLRPKKELCAFAKVQLKPHEKKTVKLPVKLPTVYQSGEYVSEKGIYEFYVGSSSFDIRLSVRVSLDGKNLTPDGEEKRDYIQSVTNVTEDNYTLEAKYRFMKKKSFKNLLIGFGLLVLAISLAVFNAATDLSSTFIGIIASALGIFSVVFLAMELLERNRNYEEEKEKVKEKNQEYFAGAEQLPMFSAEKMLNDEFDVQSNDVYVESDTFESTTDDDEMEKYVDSDFSISDFAKDLYSFAEDRGMKFDIGAIENFAASLASSRLLVLDGMNSDEFNSFILILSEYFATKAYVDTLNGSIRECYSLFFANDEHGDYIKRPSALALEDASNVKERLQILAIDGVDSDTFATLVQPFASYIASPKKKNDIRIFNDRGANVGYNIPSNVKIIVRLADHTPIDAVVSSALRMISYNMISSVKCQTSAGHTDYHGCTKYQLDFIHDKENKADNVPDTVYGRIDKLEKYASDHSDYKIGNKLWLNFEKQIGLLLSLNKEVDEAIDIAVATKILPSMAAAMSGKLTSEDETLKGTVEFVLGEENISECTKFMNSLNERNTRLAALNSDNKLSSEKSEG